MSQQRGDRIVTELMDVPHVAGTRVDVLTIHDAVEKRELDPHLVAEQHNLRPADVFHALAYYYDHPKEMHELQQERDCQDRDFKRLASEHRPEGLQD